MLSFWSSPVRNVSTRREFLRVGGMGLAGLSLSEMLAMKASAFASRSPLKDKSVIFVFMHGGPSQYETFDPKMGASSSIRSATGDTKTTLPGVQFGGTFTKLAQRAHLLNVVRSFVTGDGNHDIKPVVGTVTNSVNMGSLYSRVAGPMRRDTAMPTNAMLFPRSVNPEAGPAITSFGDFTAAGELGAAYSPFVPGAGGGMQEDLQLNLPKDRITDRRQLLHSLDDGKRILELRQRQGMDQLRSQAFEALLQGVSEAFDWRHEDPAVIARYDTAPLVRPEQISKKWNNHPHYVDHATNLGKLLLLARRLCERGCGFVTVTTSFVWDMHADINNAPMDEGMGYVGAPFDHALAALIDDLEARGLRDRIMVVCCGEMGRTPQLNPQGGRDHWGNLAPLIMYGGGHRLGQVIGQSSRDGGEPASDPVTIADLTSTIMHTLLDIGEARLIDGIPKSVMDAISRGRPIPGMG